MDACRDMVLLDSRLGEYTSQDLTEDLHSLQQGATVQHAVSVYILSQLATPGPGIMAPCS